jgi:hypothetical protein
MTDTAETTTLLHVNNFKILYIYIRLRYPVLLHCHMCNVNYMRNGELTD